MAVFDPLSVCPLLLLKMGTRHAEATAITGGSSKLGLKVDKAARVSAVFVQQKQSLDTQVAILSKSQSLAAAHAGSSMPKYASLPQ